MGAILCPRKNRRSVDEYTGTSRSDQTLVGVGRGRRAGTRPIASSGLPGVAQQKVRVVELRFFAGLTVEETAEVLKVSLDTVARDWRLAKVWLHEELQKGGA